MPEHSPDGAIARRLSRQVILKPDQELQSPILVLAHACRVGAAGRWMLPVLIPAAIRDEDRKAQAELGAKCLILICSPKTLLETSDGIERRAANEQSGRRRRCAAQKANEQLGWLYQAVARHTQILNEITRRVLPPAGPAIPPFNRPIDHGRSRLALQNRGLLGDTIWQPHVVRVKKGDMVATRVVDSKITRGTHSSIDTPGVVDDAATIRICRCVSCRDQVTAVSGSIIHQHKLQVRICLGANARDRLLKVGSRIEKDDDGRDKWRLHTAYFPRAASGRALSSW